MAVSPGHSLHVNYLNGAHPVHKLLLLPLPKMMAGESANST